MERFRRIIFWVFAPAVCLFAFAAHAVDADITDISGTNYFPAVHRQLQAATNSIHMVMYCIRITPSDLNTTPRSDTGHLSLVTQLLNDLVDARARGVAVRVILDHSYEYDPVSQTSAPDDKNDLAYEYLRQHKIDVSFGAPDTTLHSKVIVVDNAAVIVGSANWTEAALTQNSEHSALIVSPELARKTLAGFDAIETVQHDPTPCVRVPNAALFNRALFPRMLTKHDERAFDLYLLLLKQAQESFAPAGSALTINYDAIAADLGIGQMPPNSYRRQISKTLRKLQKRYNVIKCEFKHGKDARAALLPTPQAERRKEGYFSVPVEFWEYGYSTNLTLSGKFMYFVNIYRTETSRTRPWWSRPRCFLSDDFHVSEWVVTEGMHELADRDILEIRYSRVQDGDYAGREPNRYRLKPLISPEALAAEWRAIEEKYDGDLLAEARELACSIDMPNSRMAADSFARLITEHGIEVVREATEIVAGMRRDNACRHIGYVVGIMQRMEEGAGRSDE